MQAFVKSRSLTFPVLLDEDGSVAQEYRVRGIPASFFITREGVIRIQQTGPLDESLLREYLGQVL